MNHPNQSRNEEAYLDMAIDAILSEPPAAERRKQLIESAAKWTEDTLPDEKTTEFGAKLERRPRKAAAAWISTAAALLLLISESTRLLRSVLPIDRLRWTTNTF